MHPSPTSPAAVYPVELLASQILGLEAAMLRTMAEPAPAAVHHLRTGTRRSEAQLNLLAALPELEQLHRTQAHLFRAVRRLLRTVRREAGQVRDLDVQRDALHQLADTHPGTALAKQASKLARALAKSRDKEAGTLATLLKKHAPAFTRDLEKLLHACESARPLALAPERLAEVAERWFTAQRQPAPERNSEGALHDVRKAAKLTRYLLEGKVPGTEDRGTTGLLRTRAKAFAALQGAGGTWHDLLTLAKRARRFHGKRSRLAAYLAEQQTAALGHYREQLQGFSPSAG